MNHIKLKNWPGYKKLLLLIPVAVIAFVAFGAITGFNFPSSSDAEQKFSYSFDDCSETIILNNLENLEFSVNPLISSTSGKYPKTLSFGQQVDNEELKGSFTPPASLEFFGNSKYNYPNQVRDHISEAEKHSAFIIIV